MGTERIGTSGNRAEQPAAGERPAGREAAGAVDLGSRTIPQQRRALMRRDAILDATLALLMEREVGEITTTLIAARAGVPVGLVYRYFPNKFAILSELARRAMDRVDTRLEALMAGGMEPQAIARAVDEGIETIIETYRLEPGPRRLFRAVRTVPELASVLATSNARMVAALRRTLAALRPDASALEVEAVARTTVQVYTHLEALAIECDNPDLFPLLLAEWKRLAAGYLSRFATGQTGE
ncbi:TetR/AcrR family transcriptional regulator [Rhodocista pekingensis]|uniref:TetR/AcrR family transcriptional regulator n=1 Tax=Rhodocista pekingensis TaxID=201185 RepID=A0ABW2KZH6_9PROT